MLAPLAAQEKPPEPPSPVVERAVTGSFDFGYRWTPDLRGDFNTYRSVVNQGEGPKLFGADWMIRDPSRRLFDKLTVSAHNWGGDPNNAVRVEAERSRLYRMMFRYDNLTYFNFLPSFANPAIGRGELVNQRAFDTRRRNTEAELELFPSERLIPFISYSRNSSSGSGITPFVDNGNEYPVATALRDSTNRYAGGLRLELRNWRLVLEQGGTTFKDDQRVFTQDRNPGNRTTPVLGQSLFLSDLEQAYGVRGDSVYTKAAGSAAPAAWADLYGQFLYSQPRSDVHYSASARGLFLLAGTRFFNGQEELLSSLAKQPHTSASAGAELRPHRRLRLVESWTTDRYHNAASALLTEQILFAQSPAEVSTLFSTDRLALNWNRQQVDAFLDVTSKVTLRGGHRYLWGDASTRGPRLSPTGAPDVGEMRRHAGLAGLSVRAGWNTAVHLDYEGSGGDRSYFRTSLHEYHQVKVRARVQPLSSLQLSGAFLLLDNRNPTAGTTYEFRSMATTASAMWTPGGGKRATVSADYTRSTLRSDIRFLIPQTRDPQRSFYQDDAHSAGTLVHLKLPAASKAEVSLGGSLFISSGSRPDRYYQPLGRLRVTLRPRLDWYAEWRWYSLFQRLYQYEGFRSHQFVTGLRWTR